MQIKLPRSTWTVSNWDDWPQCSDIGAEDFGVSHWTYRNIQQNILLCCEYINIPWLAKNIMNTTNLQMAFTALTKEAKFLC